MNRPDILPRFEKYKIPVFLDVLFKFLNEKLLYMCNIFHQILQNIPRFNNRTGIGRIALASACSIVSFLSLQSRL